MVPADETLNPADDEVRVDSADQVTGDEFGGVTGDGEGVVEPPSDTELPTPLAPEDVRDLESGSFEERVAEAQASVEPVAAPGFEDVTKEELAAEEDADQPAVELTEQGADAVKLYEALAVLWGVASGATGRDVAREFLNQRYPDFVATAKERETAARLS